MKKLYIKSLIAMLAFMVLGISGASAQETWSYDWPTKATTDKNAGFYNLSDETLTTQSRVLNGKEWTINVPAGTYLAFTTSSKQYVGRTDVPEEFTLVSQDFEGVIKQVKVKARQSHPDATVSVNVGGTDMVLSGGSETKASITATSATEAVEHTFVAPAGELTGNITITFRTGETTASYYIIYLEVVYEETTSSVADPVITPASGSYDETQTVSITAEEGTEIRYTLDGSDPRLDDNTAAAVYNGSFTLDKSANIVAAARLNGEWSRLAKADIIIRQPAGISFEGTELTVEYPDGSDGLKLNNPNNVKVKYTSSDQQGVAAVTSSGAIWTMGIGDCDITATFEGDDNYQPASCSYKLHVIAKEPLAAPVVTPNGGDFDKAVTVTVTGPDDERLTGFNYMISATEPELDEYGAMPGSCQSAEGTSFTLNIDETSTLWVQAKGHLLWSPMVKATFNVNLPVEAAFTAEECKPTAWSCGFDSEEELDGWSQSAGAQWGLKEKITSYMTPVPAFSSINESSKYSLYHAYTSGKCDDLLTTPEITVPESATLSFWALFNPVWIYNQNLTLYVYANDQAELVWNAFAQSQEAGTDDAKWTKYEVSLAKYAGQTIQLAWRFEGTYGDDIMVDDMKITYKSTDTEITANINAEESVHFTDLSTGKPSTYAWIFPGGVPAESTEANPVVTYPAEGVYDVTLTVSNAKGESSTVTRKGFVKVTGIAPTAAIAIPEGAYYSPEASLVVPLNTPLTFKDASKGNPTEWSWTLPGTDTPTATTRDVTAKYTTKGMHDVDLTVKNAQGTSSTYIYGIKAGEQALVWNIPPQINNQLGIASLSFYGYYGGSNWLGMEQYAEYFAKPLQKIEISKVNIYFGSVTHDPKSEDTPIVVSVCASEGGKPGKALASASLSVKELVDASETYNDPTEFVFAEAVTVADEFFITVAGIPNNETDAIAIYAVSRDDGVSTTYHYMEDLDDEYNPLGTKSWYYNVDEPLSLAIAPQINYLNENSGIESIAVEGKTSDIDWSAPVDYYTLQGVHVKAENLTTGIYIVRQGTKAAKIAVRR